MARIAIIGSGPTGIYTLKGLISHPAGLSITVFEESPDPGKGTPYHPAVNDKAMLANIASIEIPPIIDSLVGWLRSRSNEELQNLGIARDAIGEREFYPRIVLGDYFAAQFWELVRRGHAAGHTIDVRGSCRIADIALNAHDLTVTATSSESSPCRLSFDHVVMATGHDWPQDTETSPGYFASPWPAAAIKRIKAVKVGVLGTSLSGIDAVVSVATAHGMFLRDDMGALLYQPLQGREDLHITMMSRKGLLPEADFYCPIPYEPLAICTPMAVEQAVHDEPDRLLDAVFDLFKQELARADPDFAARIGLALATVEDISDRYFRERTASDQFVWAGRVLAQAKRDKIERNTVPWRYAILRMHEVIARAVPHFSNGDLGRFHKYFKTVFVDDYATVPHESIERLLALHNAGKLEVMATGSDYTIEKTDGQPGVELTVAASSPIRFAAFIDATGQHPLSAKDIPFESLRRQDVIRQAQTPTNSLGGDGCDLRPTGGIDVDESFRPKFEANLTNQLYCVSVPFLLHKLPFVQGITSASDMGEIVSESIRSALGKVSQLLPFPVSTERLNRSPTPTTPTEDTVA